MILKEDILQLKISLKEAVGDELTDEEFEQPIDDTFGTLRYETHNEDESISVDGTSLVGRLYGVSYPKLVTYFGEPIRPNMGSNYDDDEEQKEPDPSDPQASWLIRFADNLTAEIYDRWQDMSPESITEWRVAGKGSTVLHRIHLVLEGKGKRGFGSNVLENTEEQKQEVNEFSQENWVERVKQGFNYADGSNRRSASPGEKYFPGYWLQKNINNIYDELAEHVPIEDQHPIIPPWPDDDYDDYEDQPSNQNRTQTGQVPVHEKIAGMGVPLQLFVDEFTKHWGGAEVQKFIEFLARYYPDPEDYYRMICMILIGLWIDFKSYSKYLAEGNGGYDHALVAIENAWRHEHAHEMNIMIPH